MSSNKNKGRKTRKNRRNRHLRYIRVPILDKEGKKIGEREAQVPSSYKGRQAKTHRKDATVINSPAKEHSPCCDSPEAIDKKNQSMLREIQTWRVQREWNKHTGRFEAVIPAGFRRKYRKHMAHFLQFLETLK